jgi:hypothetical protein
MGCVINQHPIGECGARARVPSIFAAHRVSIAINGKWEFGSTDVQVGMVTEEDVASCLSASFISDLQVLVKVMSIIT